MCSVSAGTASSKSHLFMAMRCGMFFAFRRASKSVCASVSPSDASTTTTRQITLVHHLHGFPDALGAERTMSSRPGVSIITTGPSGSNSMALETGSVVVPATSETMARSCPGHRVDETGFSGVALTENADMYALRIGRCVHAHTITSNSESFPICGKWGFDVFEHSIPHEYHFVKCTEGVYRCSLREPRRLLESALARRGR